MKEEKREGEGGAMMSAMLTDRRGWSTRCRRGAPAFLSCGSRCASSACATSRAGARVDHRAVRRVRVRVHGKPREERVADARRAPAGRTRRGRTPTFWTSCTARSSCRRTLPRADHGRARARHEQGAVAARQVWGGDAHPIVGVTNINLTKLVPTYQRIAAERRRCERRRRRRSAAPPGGGGGAPRHRGPGAVGAPPIEAKNEEDG